MRNFFTRIGLFSLLAVTLLARPAQAQQSWSQALGSIDCNFQDGFSPPVGYSGSQSDLVMSKLPVAVGRQATDLDRVIADLVNRVSNGQDNISGDAGQQAFADWLDVVNTYAVALHAYSDAIQTISVKYSTETSETKKTAYAEKTCAFATAAGSIIDRVSGYLERQMADIYNGVSTAAPASGTLPAAMATKQTAEGSKAQAVALTTDNGQAPPAPAQPTDGQAPSGSVLTLPLPLGDITLPQIIGRVIKTLLSIIGAIALVFFLWGGFQYLTSAGDSDKAHDARNTIVAAVSGIAAVFLSYAILTLILNAVAS